MEAAQQISADRFFLGVTGVHETAGLTTGDAEEAAMKRALAGRASETFVLGSAEKIGSASPYRILPVDQITELIVDDGTSKTVAELAQQGVPVRIAR
jgi:DeoR/GlpR family transcriptional regulator of sugar metabolism